MSKKIAALDRLLFGLIGLAFIAVGVWPILVHFRIQPALYLASWIDHEAWRALPNAGWWPFALAVATVLFSLCALWIIISNIRHHRFSTIASATSDHEGAISTSMSAIAGAVAETIAQLPGVDKVHQLAAYDRGRPTLQYTIIANPDTSLSIIEGAIEENERDFREAFGDADLDTVYKIHFSKVRSQKSTDKSG